MTCFKTYARIKELLVFCVDISFRLDADQLNCIVSEMGRGGNEERERGVTTFKRSIEFQCSKF